MSVLARPLKRKLNELEELQESSSCEFRSGSGQSETPGSQRRSTVRDGRESESTRASPICFDSPLQAERKFSPQASVVLVGIRGTGKSSLAVMLAATSGKRLIDASRYFERVTGRSRPAYKKDYGLAEYRQQEARAMESMLHEHREGCVIACGPGSMERTGQKLLREYARTHPVVHIIRDAESIQSYLDAWDTDKIRRGFATGAGFQCDCVGPFGMAAV